MPAQYRITKNTHWAWSNGVSYKKHFTQGNNSTINTLSRDQYFKQSSVQIVNNLFICKKSYYKRLLKFQLAATEKVEAIKKEIQDTFQARPGDKRLPCPSDRNDDEISDVQRSLSTNRVKVSRTLPFSNNISTPRASSFGRSKETGIS